MLEEKPTLITRREFGRIALSSGLFVLLPLETLADAKKNVDQKTPKKYELSNGRHHVERLDSAKPIVHNWLQINQNKPLPSGGAGLQISPNGDWQFTGHLYDSQQEAFELGLMIGVLSSSGTLYTFQTMGTMTHGQLYQWDRHNNSKQLKDAWNDLIKAHDWSGYYLMQQRQVGWAGVIFFGATPQNMLNNVENHLNAVGPVVAICS